jgi:hypothetical protein
VGAAFAELVGGAPGQHDVPGGTLIGRVALSAEELKEARRTWQTIGQIKRHRGATW